MFRKHADFKDMLTFDPVKTALSAARSKSAKQGFKEEKIVRDKLNKWQYDEDGRQWVFSMMDEKILDTVSAIQLSSRMSRKKLEELFGEMSDIGYKHKKADVVVKLSSTEGGEDTHCLSIKQTKMKTNRNHVDRRPLKDWDKIWHINDPEVYLGLELMLGVSKHEHYPNYVASSCNFRDKKKRRLFIDEIREETRDRILEFFRSHKKEIIRGAIQGYGKLKTEWILILVNNNDNETIGHKLINIEDALEILFEGDVSITSGGNISIGRLVAKRCGGSSGGKGAYDLNFQFNPLDLLKNKEEK